MVHSTPALGGRCNKHPQLSKQDLSPSRASLIELMQEVNFGRIENLLIRDCDPVLNPKPRVVREHKFGGENGPRPERDHNDFKLKGQIIELFEFFDELGNGIIEAIEVKHGLPFRVIFADPAD